MPLIAIGGGLVVGAVLGLLGAGGSLLTVPALVFLLGMTITEATGTSLLIVIAMSAAGLWIHRRAGRCSCRHGLVFAGAGTLVAVAASRAALSLPEAVLTIVFIAVLLVAAVWVVVGRDDAEDVDGPEEPRRIALVGAGGAIGALTGLLGVGGGFVIVPALRSTMHIDVRKAVGTSQLVILINAVAALLGRGGEGIVWGTGAIFAVAGMLGATIGARLAGKIDGDRLRYAFAGVAVLVAIAMVVRTVVGGGGAGLAG